MIEHPQHLVARLLPPLLALLLLAGCAPDRSRVIIVDDPAELPSIEDVLADELLRLAPGTPLHRLRDVLPDAEYVASREGVQAWRVVRVRQYVVRGEGVSNLAFSETEGRPGVRLDRQELWIYVQDDKVLAWGWPHQWPNRREITVQDY